MRTAPLAALLLATACLRVPLRPDRPELDQFAPTARGAPPVEVTPLLMARKQQPRCGLAWEAPCLKRADLVYVAYLVRHPRGTFLIDAGLSSHAEEDLAHFSLLARLALAVDVRHGLAALLPSVGNPHIDFVILTHPHWDHASGLTDLPGATVWLTAEDRAFVEHFQGSEPAVMPAHFKDAHIQTYAWDGPAFENFPASHDFFGDGSVVAVPLPGHTPGAVGIFLDSVRGRRVLFVGDTVWNRDGYLLLSHKPKPLSDFTDVDTDRLSDNIRRLAHLHSRYPELIIVPAHDGAAALEMRALAAP
jgi:glyoxylase-like metal-dependent hydrolase (beta-lactamase superfamily II)